MHVFRVMETFTSVEQSDNGTELRALQRINLKRVHGDENFKTMIQDKGDTLIIVKI
jgi:hypothetical protein